MVPTFPTWSLEIIDLLVGIAGQFLLYYDFDYHCIMFLSLVLIYTSTLPNCEKNQEE